MIASGSLTPGADPARWGLPAGTALRYERPAEHLRALLPSYAVLDSDPAVFKGPHSWALPGWPQIWIVLTAGPITVRLRNRRYAPLGSAVLYGGTSRAMPVTSQGGITVVVDLSPLGWARLVGRAAEEYRDRITPLDLCFPAGWTEELIDRVGGSGCEGGVKAALDAFFGERLPPPHRDEPLIADVQERLLRPAAPDSATIAAELSLHPRLLLRRCNRHFGYGPTALARRTRLLRVLSDLLMRDATPPPGSAPDGYHDAPHFVREGRHFLGLTPRQFLAMPMEYLRAALRARQEVLGAPVPLLDRL